MNREDSSAVDEELARTLYASGVTMGLLSAGACAVLGTAIYLASGRETALAWPALVGIAAITRIPLVRAYEARAQRDSARVWLRRFTWQSLLFGAAWGSGAWLCWSDSPVVLLVLAAAYGGAYLGGVMALGPHVPAWVAYAATMGTPFIVRCFITPAVWAYGASTFLFCIAGAVFVRRFNAVLRTTIEMRFENRRLVEALAVEKESALAANAAKTAFLAAASHDLRQPVHAVRLFVAALASTRDDEGRERLLARLGSVASSLGNLLDTLLDLSRADAGIVKPVRSVFPLDDLFCLLDGEWREPALAAGLELTVAPTSVWVESDRELVTTILRNFLSNAVRYTGKGGILLGCKRAGQGMVSVRVWDTGPGIAPAHHEDVFREFVQLGNPERHRERGLGLGLAVCRRFAAVVGHPIRLRSTLERGSCFSLEVPRAMPLPTAPAELGDESCLRGKYVLVVDDDENVLTASSHLLAEWGATVRVAHDATDALAIVESGPLPDLVIADLRLRGERSGLEFMAALRRRHGNAARGVLVTGDTSPSALLEAYRQGVPLLHKPVSPQRLRQTLEAACAVPQASLDDGQPWSADEGGR